MMPWPQQYMCQYRAFSSIEDDLRQWERIVNTYLVKEDR